jgi:N-acetylneuraminic acid mutarotase
MKRFFLVCIMATPSMAAEREYPPLPRAISSFGAAVADGNVYVYGGHSGKAHTYSTETTLGQFLRLNLAKPAKWEQLTGGPILQGLAVVAHGGKIYRIGGMQPKNKPDAKSDTISVAAFARFDPKANKWEDLPDLPECRSSHDAAVLGDRLFVAGGWKMNGAAKESDWHTTMLVVDLKKEPLKWESVEQPFKRRALTMAAVDGKVYVIGGLAPDGKMERSVEVYDPEKQLWSKGAEIPDGPMNGFSAGACVCGGRLYLNPADGIIYRLSEKGAWDEVASLKQPRFVHRVVSIGKHEMLAIGGASHKGTVSLTELIAPSK